MVLVKQSEENHTDPSIWPPVIEDATSSQMVSLILFPQFDSIGDNVKWLYEGTPHGNVKLAHSKLYSILVTHVVFIFTLMYPQLILCLLLFFLTYLTSR